MQWEGRNAKSSENIKNIHLFLFSRGMGEENVRVHKKCLQGKNDVIFCWLVSDLFGIWLVCGGFGWFVGGLWVIWLVCEEFWVLQLTYWNKSKKANIVDTIYKHPSMDLTDFNSNYLKNKNLFFFQVILALRFWIILSTIQTMNFWTLLHQTLFYHTSCSQLELLATQKH